MHVHVFFFDIDILRFYFIVTQNQSLKKRKKSSRTLLMEPRKMIQTKLQKVVQIKTLETMLKRRKGIQNQNLQISVKHKLVLKI